MSVDDDDDDVDDDDELALCQKDHDKTGVTYNNLNDLLLQKGHSAFGRHQNPNSQHISVSLPVITRSQKHLVK